MKQKPVRLEICHTKPDHRPKVPEFCRPGDSAELVVSELRRRYNDVNNELKTHWR